MLTLFGDEGRELRGWFTANNLLEGRQVTRNTAFGIAAPFLTTLVLLQIERLARGDHDKELPKVFAILQAREPSPFGPMAEAMKRAECHIFFIRGATG